MIVGDAVGVAVFDLAVLDRAAGIGDVGLLSPTPAQNSLKPPPVPEDSTIGDLKPAAAEMLGDRGREGIDGRRTDDVDLVARLAGPEARPSRRGGQGSQHPRRRCWEVPAALAANSATMIDHSPLSSRLSTTLMLQLDETEISSLFSGFCAIRGVFA